jgi:hypothetical protein
MCRKKCKASLQVQMDDWHRHERQYDENNIPIKIFQFFNKSEEKAMSNFTRYNT